jgi:hypothetical protein
MRPVATANLAAAEMPIAGNVDAGVDFVNSALAGKIYPNAYVVLSEWLGLRLRQIMTEGLRSVDPS